MSLAALLFNPSNSVDLWTQTNIDDIMIKRLRIQPNIVSRNKYRSLLHVALHSVTVTNCFNDQFMKPLMPLYKYLVYFNVVLDRQKKESLIVLRTS